MKDEKIEGLRAACPAELGGLSVDRSSHPPIDMGMNAVRSPRSPVGSPRSSTVQ